MNNDSGNKKVSNSRRDVIKNMAKVTTFIIPTLVTFKVSELKANVSGGDFLRKEPGTPYSK